MSTRDLRCNRCLGMGYHGGNVRGVWKILNCRRCAGSGQCQPEQRNPIYKFKRA